MSQMFFARQRQILKNKRDVSLSTLHPCDSLSAESEATGNWPASQFKIWTPLRREVINIIVSCKELE